MSRYDVIEYMNFTRVPIFFLLAITVGCSHGAYRFAGPLGTVGKEVESRQVREERALAQDQESEKSPAKARASRRSGGKQVAKAAERYLGASRLVCNGTSYRYDCSGLVMAAHARAGLPVQGNTASLYAQGKSAGRLHKRKTPRLGDLAFFDNTHDRNGNGKLDDRLTHIAVVTAVGDDGTITMVHKSGKGVVTLYMNLRKPDVHRTAEGELLNDYLRRKSGRDSGRTRYLAGELWVGFASLWEVSARAVARNN
jgi:hypothetical protein